MKIIKTILLVLILSSSCAMAAPAKEESIKQLLTVTRAKDLLNGMWGQLDAMMSNVIQQSLGGKKPTPKEQQAITNMKNKMVAVMQKELSWEKMEPLYVRMYAQTFTEEEVSGMLVFYRTPSGQAVVTKMPRLMQNMMGEMQQATIAMMPQIQKIQAEFAAELEAAHK